jgi:hypothetical protein
MNKCTQENGKVPRCGRELPPPANSAAAATSKIWLPAEANQQNLATDTKIGLSSRKRKGTKVRHEKTDKNLPPTQFGAKTQNFKSVKMIISYGQ